jgi:hypothetical protein
MGAIVVPYDYTEESNFYVIPICIGDIDPDGYPIHRAWVEHGIVPIADPLRKIAGRVLNDVWSVSEITERAVHSLSRKHREDLGDEPSLRVLKRALVCRGSSRGRPEGASQNGSRAVHRQAGNSARPVRPDLRSGSEGHLGSIDGGTRPPRIA